MVLLKAFQSSKKWNPAKEKFWFDENDEPIRGILAKLLMNSFPGESTAANKNRAHAVLDAAGLNIKTLTSAMPHGEVSEAAIYSCLQVKY